MAFGLIRWPMPITVPDSAAHFPELVDYYSGDGGIIEWVRSRLRETDLSRPIALIESEPPMAHLNCVNSCGGSGASILVCEERLRRKKLLYREKETPRPTSTRECQ